MSSRWLPAVTLLCAAWGCRVGYDPLFDSNLNGSGAAGLGSAGGSGAQTGGSGAQTGGSGAQAGSGGQAGTASQTAANGGADPVGGTGAAGAPALVLDAAFPNFDSIAGLHLVGSATARSGTLEVAPPVKNQVGAFYLSQPLAWTANSSLAAHFVFRVVPVAGSAPADGFVFVLQSDALGLAALGDRGGALGYALGNSGIHPSLGVEYDVFSIGLEDPPTEHLAVLGDGQLTSLSLNASLPVMLASGDPVHSWVDYSELSQTFAVYLSATSEKPNQPVLVYTTSLLSRLGNSFFLGVTASTGEAFADLVIDALYVQQSDGP